MNNWQAETTDELIDLLQPRDEIQAAILVGSLANTEVVPDQWSDIDIVIVLRDDVMPQYFPDNDWLEPIGAVYSFSQSQNPPFFTSRVCLTDTRRIDLVLMLESAFKNTGNWPSNPFQYGYRVLFSKSEQVETILASEIQCQENIHDPEADFERIANEFWFKGMLVASKVARNDLLIAQHLALDLVRDCLVVGMMLRDRELNSRHHRHGGLGNDLVEKLAIEPPKSGVELLNAIGQTSHFFDSLGLAWSRNYQENRFVLLNWIDAVKNNMEI